MHYSASSFLPSVAVQIACEYKRHYINGALELHQKVMDDDVAYSVYHNPDLKDSVLTSLKDIETEGSSTRHAHSQHRLPALCCRKLSTPESIEPESAEDRSPVEC